MPAKDASSFLVVCSFSDPVSVRLGCKPTKKTVRNMDAMIFRGFSFTQETLKFSFSTYNISWRYNMVNGQECWKPHDAQRHIFAPFASDTWSLT